MQPINPFEWKRTLATIAFSLLLSLPNLAWGDVPAGKWWILGNVTRGSLEFEIDAQNKVTGSIYVQPIRGSWDPERGEINFIRYSDTKASIPMQSWNGKLVEVDCNSRKVPVLEGTFHELDAKTEEGKNREYKWSGQLESNPAPSLDFKHLQGDWLISGIVECTLPQGVKLPDEFGLDKRGVQFSIQGNKIKVGNQVTATFSNDLQSAELAKQVGFHGSRVMVLNASNGQGLICSYFIENDIVEIAYPHTAFCHRGSGHILRLTRVTKDSSEAK